MTTFKFDVVLLSCTEAEAMTSLKYLNISLDVIHIITRRDADLKLVCGACYLASLAAAVVKDTVSVRTYDQSWRKSWIRRRSDV